MLPVLSALTALTARLQASPSGEELPLWKELWIYFVEKYFPANFDEHNYQSIHVGNETLFTARGMIVALGLGVIVAAIIATFQKGTLGDLVRALDREGCLSPDKAMTLEQLGLARNAAIKQSLRHGTSLRRVVRCVEEEAQKAEQAAHREAWEALPADKKRGKWKETPYRYDFSTDRFYIPVELADGAALQFERKGSSPRVLVITIIVCIILTSVVCTALPEVFQLLDNILNAI